MSAPLQLFVSEESFKSGTIYDPITDAVENCVDIYVQSGVSIDKMPAELAGLYHLEYYVGRINGSGHRYYLDENSAHAVANLSNAKFGAKLIGWIYGVGQIEKVSKWVPKNVEHLDTLIN